MARALECEPEQLRQFKRNGSLGIEILVRLIAEMESRGFTQRDELHRADIMDEVRGRLEEILKMLNNPSRGRDRKARILLNEIEVIHREYGPELHEMGKLNPEQNI